MSKLCERPGCSERGAAEYGMVPEDLLFWIAPLSGTPHDDQRVLCLRHADALTVPRGWTLDDRREPFPRLFRPRQIERTPVPPRRTRRRPIVDRAVEQLIIDGTGEIERPAVALVDDVPNGAPTTPESIPVEPTETEESVDVGASAGRAVDDVTADAGSENGHEAGSGGPVDPPLPWRPAFDQDSDLDGLLEADSPLLARAFRGAGRRRD